MRMVRLLILCILIVAVTAMAQDITRIREIQYTTDPSGHSPLNGQVVTVSGTVTAEHRGSVYANGGISGSYFFMMDSSGAWSGIQIYYSATMVAEGDSIRLTGTVAEYNNQTQIGTVTSLEIISSGHKLPYVTATTGDVALLEDYEGCLVRLEDVTVTEINIGNYANWKVSDGSGDLLVDTRAKYYYTPELDAPIKSLTGIILYGSGAYSIAPRIAWDIEEGGTYTRIQRIQQVRNSLLLITPEDEESDTSYARFGTHTIKGVVTMPTGLSYAGAGVKFILAEEEGGPWSGILSYHPDSTAYPALFEGDLIEMTGYIDEYTTGPSNMTEFWITSPIDILDFGLDLPAPEKVKTGDLRLPVTAEQWGNVMVYIKDAELVNYGTQYELFGLDDGSGYVLVDDDSDSIYTYYDSHPLPPLGTVADSVYGWVYHHYGSYADSTTYVLEPLYKENIVWGSGPPVIGDVVRDIAVPKSTDAVTISASITTNLQISEAAVWYAVNSKSNYSKVVMTHAGSGQFEGTIPEQPLGSFVSYFITATDEQEQFSMLPADTSVQNFTYVVTSGNLTVHDIQYTTWPIADSPFEGQEISISGVLTTGSANNGIYGAYALQDAAGAWNGVFVSGITAVLSVGDHITVTGTVTDYNPAYHYKWDNNTVILAKPASLSLNGSGNETYSTIVTTGELNNAGATAESMEGVLVRIQNATLTSVNYYDVSFDDGSGACLVDGDFMLARDQDPNPTFYVNDTDGYLVAFGDTIYVGEKVDRIEGVFTYSFGTYKIEVRGAEDFGNVVGIDPEFKPAPLTYALRQNFPNPFNPETRLYFEIPQAEEVKIVLYNVLGQKVRTLVNETYMAGQHVVNWNGLSDAGERLPSGIYIYRMKAGSYIASQKMMMLK